MGHLCPYQCVSVLSFENNLVLRAGFKGKKDKISRLTVRYSESNTTNMSENGEEDQAQDLAEDKTEPSIQQEPGENEALIHENTGQRNTGPENNLESKNNLNGKEFSHELPDMPVKQYPIEVEHSQRQLTPIRLKGVELPTFSGENKADYMYHRKQHLCR